MGIGFYEAALVAAVSIYIVLTLVQKWENRDHKKIRFIEVYIEMGPALQLSELTQQLRQMDFHIENIQFESESGLDSDLRAVIISLRSMKKEDHHALLRRIKGISGIAYIEEL